MKKEDFIDLLNDVDDKFISELYEETEHSKPAKKTTQKTIVWTRWCAIAAAIALVILGSITIHNYHSSPAVMPSESNSQPVGSHNSSVVYQNDGSEAVILDINPSIELKIDPESDTVSSIVPLNKDAESLLTTKYIGTDQLSECLGILLEDLSSNNYIQPTSNSILVSVVNGDSASAQEISDTVVKDLQQSAIDQNISLSIISQIIPNADEYNDFAESYMISVGKAALIKNITSDIKSEEFDYTQFAEMNIQTLNQIAEYIGNTTVNRLGYVSGAISGEQLDLIGIANMEIDQALNLAQEIVTTYGELVNANPNMNDPSFFNYQIVMEQITGKDGAPEWTLVAKSLTDESANLIFGFGNNISDNQDGNIIERTIQGWFDFWGHLIGQG